MARLLFEKTGNAVWISHLDLMRLFQRAFKRAGLPLTHTQGFNPRPSVSIALPLSVGMESRCELLDFSLESAAVPYTQIAERLNRVLIPGINVLQAYENGRRIRELALLSCSVALKYDGGVPQKAEEAIAALFRGENLLVEKKSKCGIVEQDILPMIRRVQIKKRGDAILEINALICCQNPSLNPMQLVSAINRYLPEYKADFAKCRRIEIYDTEETVFR